MAKTQTIVCVCLAEGNQDRFDEAPWLVAFSSEVPEDVGCYLTGDFECHDHTIFSETTRVMPWWDSARDID